MVDYCDIRKFNKKKYNDLHEEVKILEEKYGIKDLNVINDTVINDKKEEAYDGDIFSLSEKNYKCCTTCNVDNSDKQDIDMYEPRLQIGSVIDERYRVINKLGEGALGKVYLAEDIKTKKKWAIKAIDIYKKNYEQRKNKLSVEMNILNKLCHPGLPSIVDIIQIKNQLFTVEDYIEGAALSNVILEDGAQSEKNVIDWAKQLCNILGYLHEQNPIILHNDIHPRNIMLRRDGKISLINFGAAIECSLTYNNDNENFVGTTYYTAPEKLNGIIDKRTDIYSLGMTLYALVIGKDPSEPPYTLYPIRSINKNLSVGLEYIIKKCIERSPKDRYQDIQDVLTDLNNIKKLSAKLKRSKVYSHFI